MARLSRAQLKARICITAVISCIVVVAVTVFATRIRFRSDAQESLAYHAELETLKFTSSLNAQLGLVVQMVKTPSIVKYMENPDDPELKATAFEEFGSFKDSYLSKSVFFVNDKDHKFYQDLQEAYLLDPTKPENYWYNMTMYETDVYNYNINYNPDLGGNLPLGQRRYPQQCRQAGRHCRYGHSADGLHQFHVLRPAGERDDVHL